MSARRRIFVRCCGAITLSSAFVLACGWDPSRPFEREAPEVREAISHLDAGDAQSAGNLLEQYLATGQCKEGSIGTPPRVRERANGGFDLGLALFQLAERYGKRFGEEEFDAGQADDALKAQRAEQVDCALKLVRAIATDSTQPVDLRAPHATSKAISSSSTPPTKKPYARTTRPSSSPPACTTAAPSRWVTPAVSTRPILLGRDAAWNRAIALRRIEDKKDAGQDSGSDGGGDGGGDKKDDKKDDKDKDGGDNSKPDSGGQDAGGQDSGAPDSGGSDDQKPPPKKPPEPKPDPSATPPSRQNQDERMLDQLENAPTVQQEAAKKQAQRRRVRG